jgi:hypothetical protein
MTAGNVYGKMRGTQRAGRDGGGQAETEDGKEGKRNRVEGMKWKRRMGEQAGCSGFWSPANAVKETIHMGHRVFETPWVGDEFD